MTAKLFTIGDSISQGFMSGAAANTHLAYSTILAESLNISSNYRYLPWKPGFKTKVDLEAILRRLERKFGTNIRGFEWLRLVSEVNYILDRAEDYFETGDGAVGFPALDIPKDKGLHNVAVEGMDVADTYMVTPKLCLEEIGKDSKRSTADSFWGMASQPFYRNAYRVLNPRGEETYEKYKDFSPISWLEKTAREEGVENLLLWIGANNALGTVLGLDIKQTPNDPENFYKEPRSKRLKYNLWHPNDFRAEYQLLIDKVVSAMESNKHEDWHAFIGTIPLVTIAPIAKGIGGHRPTKDPLGSGKECLYYQYYTYFPFTEKSALETGKYLKYRDALFIDRTIIEFNRIIREIIDHTNTRLDGVKRLHIIDMSEKLTQMAWKRNFGNPSYEYPDYFKFQYPPLDTKYYHVNRKGILEKGGIFSLDGVHPSAVGQGLIAWEFLKEMKKVRPELIDTKIDWEKVMLSDSLIQKPITLMSEIYEHDKLINMIAGIADILRD